MPDKGFFTTTIWNAADAHPDQPAVTVLYLTGGDDGYYVRDVLHVEDGYAVLSVIPEKYAKQGTVPDFLVVPYSSIHHINITSSIKVPRAAGFHLAPSAPRGAQERER